MKWHWCAFAVFVISAVVVYGQQKRPESTADQQPRQNPQPPQANCSVVVSPPPSCPPAVGNEGKPTSTGQQNQPPNHPKSYFARLFSAENLPQVLLIFVGIGGIWVAIRTLNHLQESAERQMRAYVLPDNAGIIDGTMLTPPQPARANIPGIFLLTKNYGDTPAYRVVSWAQIAVIPVASENTLVVPPMHDVFFNTLGPGASFSKSLWFDRPLTAVELTDIANGTRAIYLYGRIEYEDAFNKKRFANFRLRYSGAFPPLPNAILNFSEGGNDAN